MKVFHALDAFEKGRHTVATIGTFDGVHLGHRAILDRVKDAARAAKGEAAIISFHPHPRLVLFPEDNPMKLLQTIDEKIALLEAYGIDKVMLIPFTREFSRLTSQQFIEQVLVDGVGIKRLVIGYDHRFGRNREGGFAELQEGGETWGYSVEEIPAQQINEANVSSTKIRHALEIGDVDTANRYLGYTYSLAGPVVEGQKMGRQLGFPTANIRPADPLKLVPAHGVYFIKAEVLGKTHFGMMNIGNKPTAGTFKRSIEANLFDFNADIYGQTIRIHFLKRIRDEQKFPSLDALKAQIGKDKKTALTYLRQINA